MQADFGATIPASGFLSLDGGVLETLAGGTFTRSFGSGGSNSFQMTANGGGFSTAGGPCAVNIGGKRRRRRCAGATNVGSQLVGTLKLCSPTCTNSVTFVNPIDLSGGARTIEVDDNPNSTADCAVLSGAISDSVGGGSLQQNGRRHALPARLGVEHLLRHDDDRGHASWRRRPAAPWPSPATSP